MVGNCIGEGSEKYGKVTAAMGTIYSAILTGIIAFCTYRYSYEIATMYTQDVDTVALLIPVLETLALPLFINGLVQSIQGTLKSLQQQKIASRILILGLYLAGLPSASFLAVDYEYGVHGLWIGYGIGEGVILFLYLLIY